MFISGYGESEKIARIDAKQQLALNIFSLVQVKETTSSIKHGNDIDSTYSQESQIESLPIEIQTLELEGVDCTKSPCRYKFRINKTQWVKNLSHDIENIYSLSRAGLRYEFQNWKALKLLFESKQLLAQSKRHLTVLSSLNSEQFNSFAPTQRKLELQVEEKLQQIPVTFRSAPDAFSSKVRGTISNNSLSGPDGHVNVYIKGTHRSGKKGNQFIARQVVSFKVFESTNPSVVVNQIELSEIATSSTSASQAIYLAQQKIFETLSKESIFTLLN